MKYDKLKKTRILMLEEETNAELSTPEAVIDNQISQGWKVYDIQFIALKKKIVTCVVLGMEK